MSNHKTTEAPEMQDTQKRTTHNSFSGDFCKCMPCVNFDILYNSTFNLRQSGSGEFWRQFTGHERYHMP